MSVLIWVLTELKMQKNPNSYPKPLSLRRKILLSMVALLLLLGLSTALITHAILLKVLKAEFKSKGLIQARSIAANSLVDVLTQNIPHLKKLVENEKSLDPDIAYVFIADSSDHILAHTFKTGFPVDLAGVNNLERGKALNIQALDTRMGLIYDIAVPVSSENKLFGQAHLGILKNSIQRTINVINLIFVGTTLLITIMAIFLAYKVSLLITKPISRLVEAVQSIRKGDFSTRIDVKAKDEIGLLSHAFNEMTSNLNMMVEEIKHLTTLQERERIALDLHDCCAQDLANIIKRLELCEKLFVIEPAKGFEELKTLRGNTREILDRTRRVIFNLRSPEDEKFNLSGKLTSYIKDYEKANGISVKLDMPDSLNDILPAKMYSIFYLITEALTNIKKHSQARNVELSLGYDDKRNLNINIKDDGRGFDVDAAKLSALQYGKWGLIGMQQRAVSLGGALTVTSQLQKGTTVSFRIPLLQGT
ncbi:MAG: HAMP domain-containing protein [Candidatus Omnitrophota bacterium]|nr:HAMP domain-containing protein [Candidatus Omnitrophota bacterium]